MNDIDTILLDLTEYAELDDSEWGETVIAMLNMWQARCLISPRLTKALEKELRDWHKDVKKNAEIVEEIIEPAPYTVKSLEWN